MGILSSCVFYPLDKGQLGVLQTLTHALVYKFCKTKPWDFVQQDAALI